jgi:hypothetical protein
MQNRSIRKSGKAVESRIPNARSSATATSVYAETQSPSLARNSLARIFALGRIDILAKTAKIGVLVWLALTLIPTVPFALNTGIDASWAYGLNMAYARGLTFGKDVIFTLGPLGYLTRPDPNYAQPSAVVWFSFGTYAVFLFGIARCIRIHGYATGLTIATVVAIPMLFSLHAPDWWQAACIGVFLAATAWREEFPVVDMCAAAVVTGITLLLKTNEGVAFCAVYYALLVLHIRGRSLRTRREVLFLVSYASLPLIILQSGFFFLQGSQSTVAYLVNSLELARGYSEAMSITGPSWQFGLALLLVGFMITGLSIATTPRRLMLSALGPALLLAFMAFKHGMVRQDGHADVVHAKIGLAVLFMMVVCQNARDRRLYAAIALFGSITTLFVVYDTQNWLFERACRRLQLRTPVSSFQDWKNFDSIWNGLRGEVSQRLTPLRLHSRFDDIIKQSTVDAFPNDIELIRANNWIFQPRPVFQSHAAFTPRLDAMNAAHIAGPTSAEYVLLNLSTIDGRHPFLEDAQSWRLLLDRYNVRLQAPQAMLLEKRSVPRYDELKPISTQLGSWNQEIRVPDVASDEALVMSADVRQTLWGRARTFLFRASPVHLQVTYRSGRQSFVRVIRPNLIGGAIISPLPQKLMELLPFFGKLDHRSMGDPVTSLAWSSPGPGELDDHFDIKWYRLRFRPGEIENDGIESVESVP